MWVDGRSNGGSPILDYSIYNAANDDLIAEGIPQTQFTVGSTYGIEAGKSYSFKVKARTAIGTSGLSKEISIVSASTPSELTSVTTTAENSASIT